MPSQSDNQNIGDHGNHQQLNTPRTGNCTIYRIVPAPAPLIAEARRFMAENTTPHNEQQKPPTR